MKRNYNALITGSSGGIGASIAETLSDSGCNVILTGRCEDRLKSLAQKLNAKYFVCDLTSENGCENLLESIQEKSGTVDILVNNAGDYLWSPVENTRNEDINRLLKLNVEAPYRLIRKCVPDMKKQGWGRIVNIGSISGSVGEANASLYSLTKSAFAGLTKSLALELAMNGITVNTINPGWVETELTKNACESGDFSEEENVEMIPQRRFIEPSEVAHLVEYLVSPEAKGLTGQCISLCAGLSVG